MRIAGQARSRLRHGGALVATFALASSALVMHSPAASASASPCTDATTPAAQSTVTCTQPGSYVLGVPGGTTTVDLTLAGGGGAGGYYNGTRGSGGNGAAIAGTLNLPGGTAFLKVVVASGGVYQDSRNASGGGGGSGVYALDSGHLLLAKLAIAGGGGGGAYNGAGGNAGAGSANGSPGVAQYSNYAVAGQGATGATGGIGGYGSGDNASDGSNGGNNNPSATTPAAGGSGGDTSAGGGFEGHGGEGGGGYAGGGGGGAGGDGFMLFTWAPAGGGTSYISSSVSGASSSIVTGSGGTYGVSGSAGSAALTFNGPAVPGAPTGVSATAGDHQAVVSFTAPGSDGGSPITSYTVTSSPGAHTASCAGSPCTVTGLTDGTSYTFTVHATNTNGNSAESTASTSVTPAAIPGAPTGVTATAGAGQASVSFTAPSSNGGSAITAYTVTSAPGGVTHSCPGSPCVVTGLTNGTTYTFTVHATNAIGNSPESGASAAVTPVSVPASPTGVVAQPGDGQASVSFVTPTSDGGLPITSYTVTSSPGAITSTCSASPCVITGLTNGTSYTFTVRATNSLGDSAASEASAAVTPASLPGAPTGAAATAGDGQASVTFAAPASNGGSAITSYTVTSSPGGLSATCPGSPCVISGLSNGTSYTFTVHATNAIGESPESSASSVVTPAGAPAAPTSLTVTSGDSQAGLSFPVPADGGSPITGYQVSTDGGLTWTTLTTTTAGSTVTGTVTGLTNGVVYSVKVRAVNGEGPGSGSGAQPVTPATTPDAPTAVSGTTDDGQAAVSFTAPADDGGSTITSYTVTASPGGSFATCPDSPCTVAGLDNGTSYTFVVVATNSVGDSVASAPSAAVVPAGTPDAPGSVSLTPGDGQVSLSFSAPGDEGSPITGYEVSTDGGLTYNALPTTTTGQTVTATVTGLTNGTSYSVRVRAVNGQGAGAASTPQSVTPVTTPGVPTGITATRGNGAADVAFMAPADDGGSPITGYTVTAHPGGQQVTCTASPCQVTGLENGTSYDFTVHATTTIGDSAESDPSNSVTPAVVPTAPQDVVVTGGDQSATVSFPAPSPGGSPITGYEVSVDGGTTWLTLTASTTGGQVTGTVTGLTNGTDYSVQVRAINSVGTGLPSAAQSVTPATTPDAPTAVTAAGGAGQATVSFTPPVSSGGAAITGYTVTASPGGLTATCTTSPCVVTGLTNGTSYTFTVTATNRVGNSEPSAASPAVTPLDVPARVAVAATSVADTSVQLSFSAPYDGGSPITGYEYSLDGGATWHTLTTATSADDVNATITGLDSGTTYSLSVRAVNVVGAGTGSSPATVDTLPSAVGSPTAVAGTSSATVSWTPSTTESVVGYTVYAYPGPATCTTTATTCVIGATAGVHYTYTVVAHTAGANSATSAASTDTVAAAPKLPASAPLDAATTLTTTHGKLTSVTAGQVVVLVGQGYLPYSTIALAFYSGPSSLGTVVADANGRFQKSVTVPDPATAGADNLVAAGVDVHGATYRTRLAVTVAAAPTGSSTTGSSTTGSSTTGSSTTGSSSTGGTGGALPNTGFGVLPFGGWAALLLVVGAWCTWIGRRRREPAGRHIG